MTRNRMFNEQRLGLERRRTQLSGLRVGKERMLPYTGPSRYTVVQSTDSVNAIPCAERLPSLFRRRGLLPGGQCKQTRPVNQPALPLRIIPASTQQRFRPPCGVSIPRVWQ